MGLLLFFAGDVIRGWTGLNRGMILTPQLQAGLPDRSHLAVGIGRVTTGRVGLFRQQEGLAVQLVSRVFDIPPCNGKLVELSADEVT